MTILIHKVKMQMTAGGRTRGQNGNMFQCKIAYLTFSTIDITLQVKQQGGKNCAKNVICIVCLVIVFFNRMSSSFS